MNRFSQKVELIANILIILVIVLIVEILAQRYFFTKPIPTINQIAEIEPKIGAIVNLPDINWANQPKTLILALNTGCHFCNESAPFYKRLVEKVQNKSVKMIAVFPSDVEQSKAHLKELGVTNIDVKQLPLDTLQVSGTPTLILTNEKGEITNYWVGKLPPDAEAEVLNKLNSKGENNNEQKPVS